MNVLQEQTVEYLQVVKHGRIGPVWIVCRPLFEQFACGIECIDEKDFPSKDIKKYKITYGALFEFNLHKDLTICAS